MILIKIYSQRLDRSRNIQNKFWFCFQWPFHRANDSLLMPSVLLIALARLQWVSHRQGDLKVWQKWWVRDQIWILVISTLSCQKNLPLKIWHEALIMKNIYRFRRGSRTFHQWVILFAGEGCPSLLLVLLIFQKFPGGIGSGQRRLINKNTWIMEREIYCSYITDFYLYFFLFIELICDAVIKKLNILGCI